MNAIEVIRLDSLRLEVVALQERAAQILGEIIILRKNEDHDSGVGVVLASPVDMVAMIQAIVSRHFQMDISLMKSPTRTAHVAWPRQVAMTFAYEMTNMSLAQIGELFGGRDHGTVLHAGWRVRDRMEVEPKLKVELSLLRGKAVKAITKTGGELPEVPREITPGNPSHRRPAKV